jgi:hypothetical protein
VLHATKLTVGGFSSSLKIDISKFEFKIRFSTSRNSISASSAHPFDKSFFELMFFHRLKFYNYHFFDTELVPALFSKFSI